MTPLQRLEKRYERYMLDGPHRLKPIKGGEKGRSDKVARKIRMFDRRVEQLSRRSSYHPNSFSATKWTNTELRAIRAGNGVGRPPCAPEDMSTSRWWQNENINAQHFRWLVKFGQPV